MSVGDVFLRPCSRCGGWPSFHLWGNDLPLCAWCGTGQPPPTDSPDDKEQTP